VVLVIGDALICPGCESAGPFWVLWGDRLECPECATTWPVLDVAETAVTT
jgi:hypothetical protein